MKCPHCKHENQPQAKFCEECAAPLARTCANCGTQLSATAKFCPECAHPVTGGVVTQRRFASPETYTPKHLAEKILTSKSALEGERKQVTVLFADMKGSMELLADRDPEEARKLFDAVIEQMMDAVHRYEGTVNHILGDGIMALFGAPLAHEDHAVRACYAALRMQESVKRYAVEVQRMQGIPIQIRVGLNSGEVVVGSIRNDLHMDYTAIGQTAHLAARMEQMAMPGSILVTADALRLAESYVQVKPLGPVNVKGLSDEVQVYEVTGAGPARSRLQAAAARGLTRFVGRDTETEQLRKALEQARAGHGQIVSVVGEPGVGKSRLFWEFTHSHRILEWLILESGSVSYGKATPYLPVIDLLKVYFDIEDRDDPRKIREKLTGKLLTLDESFRPTLPAFLALLDVPVDEPAWETLDPPQRRQRTLDAIKRLLLRESQVQPLVLVFEDLHWIDNETQALLDSLVESLPTTCILLLVNYRPEYQHSWGSKTFYTQLRMDPLPPESAGELLQALLGDAANLRPLKQLLIARTEGNPFFLEESVRTLVETKFLVGERGSYRLEKAVESTAVPATVQAILAARIDRLPLEEKRLLQSAAVVGKDVPFALLQAIADQSQEELPLSLTRLQAAEFLYETSLFPDLEYTFKHALTHEVAYGSVLHERRRALHARIVEAIEKLYSERLSEQVERLAHHALRGELWEKAVEYLHQAGNKAAARSATQEAIAYFEQALDALKPLPESRHTIEKTIDIRIDLGPTVISKGGFGGTDVEENYTKARELCERLGNTPRLFPVLWGLARFHDVRGDYKVGRELGEQLLTFAQAGGDSGLLLQAHHELWANLSAVGELLAARTHLEEGFTLYDRHKHRDHAFLYGGHDPGACCGYHAAQVFWLLGYPDQALRRTRDALALARDLCHPATVVHTLFFAAWFHQYLGERQAVQDRIEEGMSLSTEQGFSRWLGEATFLRGWLLAEEGRQEIGIEQMLKVVTDARGRKGTGRFDAHCAALLAESYGKTGQTSEGLNVVKDAIAITQQTQSRCYEAELQRIKGELLLRQSDQQQAETCFQHAIQVTRGQSARSLELRAAMSLSRLWQKQGKKDDARKLLAEIYGWFTEGFDTADLKQAKLLLEELA
ncbi:MAG: zinc-ribbon domain-containing protein [Deltaproteobacteria bacterium]|nr:MAG: zinc-ribbon domain-containing protein [Deltaproteobacteria bacterium]